MDNDQLDRDAEIIRHSLMLCERSGMPGFSFSVLGKEVYFHNPHYRRSETHQGDGKENEPARFSPSPASLPQKRPRPQIEEEEEEENSSPDSSPPTPSPAPSSAPSPAKRSRTDTPSFAPAKVEVVERVHAACKNHLSAELQLDKQLPTPQELHRYHAQVTDEDVEYWSEETGLSSDWQFLRALCEENQREKHKYRDLVQMAVQPRRLRRHICDADGFCACRRKYFLPKGGSTLNGLLRLAWNNSTLRSLLAESAYGESVSEAVITGLRTKEAFVKYIERGPQYHVVHHGLELFIKEVTNYYQRVNALVAIESFSSYVEGYLISKSNRPCNEKLFESDVAKELLRDDPHVLLFHKEVRKLIVSGVCKSKGHLYEMLQPLFRALEAGRGMPPLPNSPLKDAPVRAV